MKNKNDSRTVIIGGILILLIGAGFLTRSYWGAFSTKDASSDQNEEEGSYDLPTLDAKVVKQKMDNGEMVRLLEVRNSASYKIEHIPHSELISFSALDVFLPDPNELVVIVLDTEDAETLEVVKNTLRKKSFTTYLLSGGYSAWKRQNLPTISFGDPGSLLDQSKVVFISEKEALVWLTDPDQTVFLLDVQSEQSYQKKHINGAKNIPLGELEKRFRELPSSTSILVYGENELTSFQAGVRLADLGFITTKTLGGDKHLTPTSLFVLAP